MSGEPQGKTIDNKINDAVTACRKMDEQDTGLPEGHHMKTMAIAMQTATARNRDVTCRKCGYDYDPMDTLGGPTKEHKCIEYIIVLTPHLMPSFKAFGINPFDAVKKAMACFLNAGVKYMAPGSKTVKHDLINHSVGVTAIGPLAHGAADLEHKFEVSAKLEPVLLIKEFQLSSKPIKDIGADMNVKTSQVKKLSITEAPSLDEITVYLEDFDPGWGKITITCSGKSWTAFWGSMGETIEKFFIRVDNGYLSRNLSALDPSIKDFDKISNDLGEEVEEFSLYSFYDKLIEKYGDIGSLPTKPNPDYQYLNRIIDAVKIALLEEIENEEQKNKKIKCTIKFSMNGFRRNMHHDIKTLKDYVQLTIDSEYVDDENFKDSMDAVIRSSNALNCVYTEDKEFSDMGQLYLETIEGEEAKKQEAADEQEDNLLKRGE